MRLLRTKINNKYLLLLCWCILQACDVTKNIPEGKYLLNEVEVTIDDKDVEKGDLEAYLRQKPNFSDLQIWLYNKGDTTSWIKKQIRKLGEEPVYFNSKSMSQAVQDMQIEMNNKGYLNAQTKAVTDTVGTNKKRMNVQYSIAANEPYRVRNYKIDVRNERAQRFFDRWLLRKNPNIVQGTIFDIKTLEEERVDASKLLRNLGYYTFSTDNLFYEADTTLKSNQVDLTLTIRDTTSFKPYRINSVRVLSGYDPIGERRFRAVDSTSRRGVKILYDRTHFIRPNVLTNNISIRPGQLYSEMQSQQTYDLLSSLSAVSRTGIEYREVENKDTTLLDCDIYISPSDLHGVELGLDGTHNAGNLGIAANIGYTHGNIFNGSEILSVKLRGAYEFIDNNYDEDLIANNYYEWGISSSLLFPKIIFPFFSHKIKQRFQANTEFGVSYDIQKRPEYTRNFLNFYWKYKWASKRKNYQHSLSILNVNFVSMPYKSDDFLDYINQEENYLTRISYDNLFTAGASYSGTYSNSHKYSRKTYVVRYGLESSGNLLGGIFSLSNAKKNADGQYNIFGNPFAQYLKFDIDYALTHRLNDKNTLAWHGALGVACPYGNSKILPFEKRYYGGGPNHVRGWNTRELGPGAYNGKRDISVQNGDINFLLNAEFRHKIIPLLEFAFFVDAGNVWTIRPYDNQVGGQFKWNSFAEELAVGSGLGIRLDLSFLIIRVDAAKKLVDPSSKTGSSWVAFDKFKSNSALYFAIGYPF